MKRCLCALLMAFCLCGCGAEETLETVADEWIAPVMAQPREISIRLPEELVMPVLEQDGKKIYMAPGYELMLETYDSGDLDTTIRSLCGYDRENLTMVETRQENVKRYDFVWSAAGESGERLGRGVILDDGNYHYCMSVLRDQGDTLVVWRDVFNSFCLI